MRLRKERSVSIVYDAVSISKDIEVIGGPLTLNFYVESGSYVPNRFLTPLVLKPIVYIVDPNKIIPEGDKSDELVKCNWYEDGEKIVSGDDYKINKDNSLTVLKNSTKDLTISFSATWLDPRKKQEITIEESVDLVCVQLAGDTSNPVLKLDKPLNWIHNPLKNDRIYTIKAYISKDKIYEGAVEWYYSTKGKEPKLIDNTLLAYEGGQYTNELKLNSAYLENCLITAKNLSNDKLKEYYWFFDEDGNPLTYNEPQYTDIEGTNYFGFPEEALTTRAKVRLEGLTLNQLIKGGDFGVNLDKSEWSSHYSKLEFTSNNEAKLYNPTNIVVRLFYNFSINPDDKHYIKWESKSTIDCKVGIRNGRNTYDVTKTYKVYSEIFNYDTIQIEFRGNIEDTEEEFFTKNCILINLTQAFGAGNEPTKEWCDEYIQGYFEGVKTVTTPLRIKSEVGKRNLIPNSKVYDVSKNAYVEIIFKNPIKAGTYTISYDEILSSKVPINLPLNGSLVFDNDTPSKESIIAIYDKETKSYTFTTKRDHNRLFVYGGVGWAGSTENGIVFSKMKLEKGNNSTPWTPAPEDNLPATGGTMYINNQLELKSVGTAKDYIEDGKLYQNIKRYYFTKSDEWILREGYPYDNFRYYMTLPFKYKATGYGVEGELVCNNFTPTSNIVGVDAKKESGTIALYRDNDSRVFLTLDKKVDDVNSVIPEGTFIDVILPETEVTNLDTSGKLTTYPNGSVFIDYVTKTSSYYIKDKGFKFEGDSSKIVSLRSGSGNNYYDISKIKKAGDNLYTHSDITEDTILTIEYETGPSIYGNNTVSYMSIKEVLDELWLENVYTYKGTEDSEGNVTWEFVRLIDIDNYEEWLTQEKISPFTLAPDGVIFGKYKADTKFLRQFPSSLYVDIIIPNRLKDGSGKVKARALVGTADGIIENPERYFKITWLKRDIKAGSKDEVIGYGEEILLDIDEKSSISIDIEDLGILKALTDEKGKYLTNENNTILVGR